MAERLQVAVFVVAYQAEGHIEQTLERIPAALRERLAEIYVVDDSSSDRSRGRAAPHGPGAEPAGLPHAGQPGLRRQPEDRLPLRASSTASTSWRSLHGDGQYAPECMPRLLARRCATARPTPCSARA